MNSTLLLLPPIINVIVTGLFAGVILRQFISRRRIYQLYWSMALLMAFFATVAYMCMIFTGPTSFAGTILFRIYYILGGALTPAWLGLGSVALVSNGKITRIYLTLLYLLSVLATFFIFFASINMPVLSQIVGTPGTGTLRPGPWLVFLIILNTLGVVTVVGVAIYSGWKLLRKQQSLGAGLRTSNVLWANILILVGDLFNAAAGTLARVLGLENIFWLIMALGWIILFIGVLLASRRSSAARPTSPTPDAHSQQSVPS
ncbi:hypothetical protein EPA93_38325 [Ktedonosporobacter rubrisoli]|uniref:Uncharacterized protein n=1 Tax=Ktedonosporobacter rubrisoli TaxID=2509675 RepID=A0A4P6K217_KTERU|nr:hypothetical protein [Ktedonosporobacter rubrisoli]QBD81516.1 hypothetical protein EPA93_38325 [Ktedonosporobacter rubrisoli]